MGKKVNNYLHWGGITFMKLCLFVCLLFDSRITQILQAGSYWKNRKMCLGPT